jgi:hypothetical protein
MRHLLVAAGLIMAALIVVYGAATMLEDRATSGKDLDAEPYLPPGTAPARKPAPPPERSRGLSLVTRHI